VYANTKPKVSTNSYVNSVAPRRQPPPIPSKTPKVLQRVHHVEQKQPDEDADEDETEEQELDRDRWDGHHNWKTSGGTLHRA
jgi:hypothetical protein